MVKKFSYQIYLKTNLYFSAEKKKKVINNSIVP